MNIHAVLANLAVLIHFAFVLFVMLGAFAVLRWPRLVWLHLPAVAWGIWIEASHGICPLTPLENHLRALAGEAGYRGGFVEHYLLPVLYPAGLTPAIQWWLAGVVVLVNGALYAWIVWRWRRRLG